MSSIGRREGAAWGHNVAVVPGRQMRRTRRGRGCGSRAGGCSPGAGADGDVGRPVVVAAALSPACRSPSEAVVAGPASGALGAARDGDGHWPASAASGLARAAVRVGREVAAQGTRARLRSHAPLVGSTEAAMSDQSRAAAAALTWSGGIPQSSPTTLSGTSGRSRPARRCRSDPAPPRKSSEALRRTPVVGQPAQPCKYVIGGSALLGSAW